jgi:hypothetical protein
MVSNRDIVIILYEVVSRPVFHPNESGFYFRGCPGFASALEGNREHFNVAVVVEITDVDDERDVIVC